MFSARLRLPEDIAMDKVGGRSAAGARQEHSRSTAGEVDFLLSGCRAEDTQRSMAPMD